MEIQEIREPQCKPRDLLPLLPFNRVACSLTSTLSFAIAVTTRGKFSEVPR